jgi:hypothetical protein
MQHQIDCTHPDQRTVFDDEDDRISVSHRSPGIYEWRKIRPEPRAFLMVDCGDGAGTRIAQRDLAVQVF